MLRSCSYFRGFGAAPTCLPQAILRWLKSFFLPWPLLSCKLLSLLSCQVSPHIRPSVQSTHWVRLPEPYFRGQLFFWHNSPPSLLSLLVSLSRVWPGFDLASIRLLDQLLPCTFRRKKIERLQFWLVEVLYFFHFLKVPSIQLMEKRSIFCNFLRRLLLLQSIPANNLVTVLLFHFFSSLLPQGSLSPSVYHSLKIILRRKIVFM